MVTVLCASKGQARQCPTLSLKQKAREGLPVSFAHHSRIAAVALLYSFFTTSVGATCPRCQDEQCAPFTHICWCVPRIGCKIPVRVPQLMALPALRPMLPGVH